MRNKITCRIMGTIIVLFVIAMGAPEAEASKLKPGKARKCKSRVEETRDLYIQAVKSANKKLHKIVNLYTKQKIAAIKGVSDNDLKTAMDAYKRSKSDRTALNMSNKAEEMVNAFYRKGRHTHFGDLVEEMIKKLAVEKSKMKEDEKKEVRKVCAP